MANPRSDNTFRGARNLQFNRTVRDSLGLRDRIDFYKFRASGQVDFNLVLSGLQSSASVRLLNSRRAPIEASNQPGNRAERILATLDGGIYYIEVRFQGRRGTTRYNLRTSATPTPVPSPIPQLGAGKWLITGNDVSGGSWNGSTITFESQTLQGTNYSVSGYFNWLGNRGEFGRENFIGTLFANNRLQLSGTEIVPPASGIVTGIYTADVTPDGKSLVNGTWEGSSVIPGTWTAIQVVS